MAHRPRADVRAFDGHSSRVGRGSGTSRLEHRVIIPHHRGRPAKPLRAAQVVGSSSTSTSTPRTPETSISRCTASEGLKMLTDGAPSRLRS